MCGICGYIGRKNITMEQLKEMNDTMYHRGPDDSGEEIYEMGGGWLVGFAQRRLSILDLSALGHQPMHSPDRRVSIVYNGEIYNFRELREELADYSFRSDCDTEVIIAAYLKWGIQCVERFNGMFAIALYDRQTQEIFLVRDRIGKKPFYYWYENDEITFLNNRNEAFRPKDPIEENLFFYFRAARPNDIQAQWFPASYLLSVLSLNGRTQSNAQMKRMLVTVLENNHFHSRKNDNKVTEYCVVEYTPQERTENSIRPQLPVQTGLEF